MSGGIGEGGSDVERRWLAGARRTSDAERRHALADSVQRMLDLHQLARRTERRKTERIAFFTHGVLVCC